MTQCQQQEHAYITLLREINQRVQSNGHVGLLGLSRIISECLRK